MKRYWGIYFIALYVLNTVFVFAFTFLFGEFADQSIPQLIASSIFYVLPFTLINFIITGFASCYLLRYFVEKKKNIAALCLLPVAGIDVVLVIEFFGNGNLSIVLIRVGLVCISFILTYFLVRRRAME